MSRYPALALFMALAASRSSAAGSSPFDILAAAAAQVRAGCKAVPASCIELKAIHAGYLAELGKLDKCAAPTKECTPDFVRATFLAAEALDQREYALPFEARNHDTRPLLRMSLLLSQKATFAWAAVAPGNAIEVFAGVAEFAPKEVDALCRIGKATQACTAANNSLSNAQLLDTLLLQCENKPADEPCSFDELDSRAEIAETAMKFYTRATKDEQYQLTKLCSFIKYGQDRLAILMDRDLQNQVAGLEKGVADLTSRHGAVDAQKRFQEVLETYRQASIEADRISSFGYNAQQSNRERINAAATQLAVIRSQLAGGAAGDAARALASDPGNAGAVLAAAYEGPRPNAGPLQTAREAAHIDRVSVPAPSPAAPVAPAIIAGDPSFVDIARGLYSNDPLKRADARRRAGLSYTVGNPGGRAPLVHAQGYPDTCAIVAQQQVLVDRGLVPGNDPAGVEERLGRQAVNRGFFLDGTPTAYSGSLLIEHGLIVTKSAGAPLDAMDSAVRRGGMVIAGVDARYLWGKTAPASLGHAILVTGVEIEHGSGKTVGYYINDSGKDPPSRGLFIPIETFQKAWDAHTKSYVEVR